MPFKKGQGGRPKGAPNKTTSATAHILERLGGPDGEQYALQLHQLACLPHADPHVRIKALAIIAPYIWRKQVERHEHTGADGAALLPAKVIFEVSQ